MLSNKELCQDEEIIEMLFNSVIEMPNCPTTFFKELVLLKAKTLIDLLDETKLKEIKLSASSDEKTES